MAANESYLRVTSFGGDKSYERWKNELLAWKIVTKVEKKKLAVAVA